MRVRKAVFPAAGWGTRFLPATKAQPKEMLPLVDKPVIQYAVEEAVAAGIEQVIIVTSSQKRAIEDHFDLNYELEHLLEEKGDIEKLRQVRHISDLAQVAYVRQKEQLGLGHAVLMAKDLIGHEPFAVILPDDVVIADRPCIGQLIHAYHQHHGSVVAVTEVPPEETSPLRRHRRRAGRRWPRSRTGPTASRPSWRSPRPRHAPSNLAVIGRYVLTPKIFDKLEQTQRGAGGEIQLTDAIQALMDEQSVFGYAFEGTPLRRRHHDGLAPGVGGAGARAAGVRRGVPRVPALARHLDGAGRGLTRPRAVGCLGPRQPGARQQRGDAHTVTEIGSTLGGRYRLVELLGQGGMATIYRARDAQLDRDVAVKLLRPEFGRDPDFLARFRDEARAAASLNHPNIVAVFDFGEERLRPVHRHGADRGPGPRVDHARATARSPPRQAARVSAEAAKALQAAHVRGHRPPRRQAVEHPRRPGRPGARSPTSGSLVPWTSRRSRCRA